MSKIPQQDKYIYKLTEIVTAHVRSGQVKIKQQKRKGAAHKKTHPSTRGCLQLAADEEVNINFFLSELSWVYLSYLREGPMPHTPE